MSVALADSYACCRKLARRTARNFYYSFAGLPRDQFRAMCVLYSYMRLCDDIGDDETQPLDVRIQRLADWEQATITALTEGRLPDSDFGTGHAEFRDIFPAVVDMMNRFEIPQERLTDVIRGVRMDLNPVEDACRFETFEGLSDYCFHVAGVVGVCCIHIWGFTNDAALPAAADCGLAFQLTNILRDIGEDADNGRIYLPAEDLTRFELSPDDLRLRVQDERFHELMEFEVSRARSYYEKANVLSDYLQPTGRPILKAMVRLYGGLLNEISRREFDVYSRRVTLPTWRKLLIAADAALHQRLR